MVFLRKAEKADMDLLFRWANDPVVRNNSFNTDPIPYENHVKWFNKIIVDSSVLQFILMDDNIPVGQIRLNVDGEEAEIGYSIGSEFRGKGYGHRILQLIAEEIQKNYPEIKSLIAKVKPENNASNKLFVSEGYGMEYTCYTRSIQRVDMEIIIRADANHNIGMGHIMRCLSLADAFKSAGCQIVFLIADNRVSELIKSRGYKAMVLNSDYTRMEDEVWPQNLQADLIIVDSYYVTANYLNHLREKMNIVGAKLIYIDDVLSFPYPVDILVDYNAYSTQAIYEKLYEGVKQPHLILGPTYAPLRAMFRNIPKKIQKDKVENILISTGGSDELHVALTMLKAIVSRNNSREGNEIKTDYVYHFLLGVMNTDKDEIKKLSSKDDSIVIHENISDMKSLIHSVDLVISAAGSTLYEISACGVPLITYSLADNQISGAEAFERLGLAVNVGDLRDSASVKPDQVMSGLLDGGAVDRIMAAIDELASDYQRRCEMGKQMQEMIDGCGADRMIRKIIDTPPLDML